MSPITKASGTKRVVLARFARNRRLRDALFLQAFAALNNSPGARAFYNRQRTRGATHYQALRALANQLVGILHGCLRSHTLTTAPRLAQRPRQTQPCSLTATGRGMSSHSPQSTPMRAM
jgi:hypothetical protein